MAWISHCSIDHNIELLRPAGVSGKKGGSGGGDIYNARCAVAWTGDRAPAMCAAVHTIRQIWSDTVATYFTTQVTSFFSKRLS
jgi:hypothetical protein